MRQRNPVRDVYIVTSHPTDRSGERFDWIDDGVALDFAAAARRTEFLKDAGLHDEPGRKYFVRTLRLNTEGTPDSVLHHAIHGLMTARRMLADNEKSQDGV